MIIFTVYLGVEKMLKNTHMTFVQSYNIKVITLIQLITKDYLTYIFTSGCEKRSVSVEVLAQ